MILRQNPSGLDFFIQQLNGSFAGQDNFNFSGTSEIPWASSTSARMRWASALVWPWLASGSVPPLDSIRMSDHQMPVLMWTDATLVMLILISSLLNHDRLCRMTALSVTSMTVGKR